MGSGDEASLSWNVDVRGLRQSDANVVAGSVSSTTQVVLLIDPTEFLTVHLGYELAGIAAAILERGTLDDDTAALREDFEDWLRLASSRTTSVKSQMDLLHSDFYWHLDILDCDEQRARHLQSFVNARWGDEYRVSLIDPRQYMTRHIDEHTARTLDTVFSSESDHPLVARLRHMIRVWFRWKGLCCGE
jgi:hypothetical protein